MVKKKFDKKNATTYSLVYQPTCDERERDGDGGAEDHDARGAGSTNNRVLHEFTSHARSQPLPEAELQKFRQKQGHPLEWLMEERGLLGREENRLDEKRRHELIELGFDDDGYDYMQHLKTLDDDGGVESAGEPVLKETQGREDADEGGDVGAADDGEGHFGDGVHGAPDPDTDKKLIISQKKILFDTPNAHIEREREAELAKAAKAIEATTGANNGVFVRAGKEFVAEDDVAFFDASQLTVMQQVSTEDDVTGMMGGVTAFAKRSQDERGIRERRNYEISELERMMEAAERAGEEDERVLGDGDLLDDFILTATEMVVTGEAGEGEEGGQVDADSDLDSDVDSEGAYSDSWFSDGGRSSLTQTTGDSAPQLIRRKNVPGPGSIASTYWREERQDRKKLLSVIDEQFEHLALEYDEDELGEMDELAEEGRIQGGADVEDFESVLDEFIRDHPRHGDFDGASGLRGKLFLAEDMEKHGFGNDHAALSIQMAKEAIRKMEAEAGAEEGKPAANAHIEIDRRKFEKEENKWDCESILSLRSNLYNHPGTITEPSSKPPRTIKLGKNGLPVGYGPTSGFVSTKMDKIGEDEGLDGEDGDEDVGGVWSKPSTGPNVRKKGETAEEKKARKAAVKAAKRESRATKKEMKVMFAQERTKASMRDARQQPSGMTM